MRFRQHLSSGPWKWLAISAGAFLVVLVVFLAILRDFSEDTRQRQIQALETALNRCIVACYAIEGKYPESLSYLQENYYFTYDKNQFFLDYQFQGDNIMPEVTILERGE